MYNCVSDTISLGAGDDVVLSTTSFSTAPLVYGVFYNCTETVLKAITDWVKACEEAIFHPMMLPMIFVELERARLLNHAAAKGTELNQKVIDMDSKFKPQGQDSLEKTKKSSGDPTSDSEIIKMLLSMSGIKNGLEGLHEQLASMRDHLGRPSDITLENEPDEDSSNHVHSVNIDLRLKEIMTEIRDKVRYYEGILGAITLATQMVCISPPSHGTGTLIRLIGSNRFHKNRLLGQFNNSKGVQTRQHSDALHFANGHGLPPRNLPSCR